jgi:RNA polymerase sigma-70 factor (ECF subfamily)
MKISPDKEQEFVSIVERNKQLIYKVCYMYADDSLELNDLYQEVVINLWKGFDNFRGDSSISSWIYRVGLNTCISYYRKSSSKPKTISLVDNIEIYEDTVKTAQIKEMYSLIGKLNKIERALILLWLDEKTYDEIAEIMGLNRNTVASRLKRIREKIVEMSNQ